MAPSDAVPLAFERAGVSMHDVNFNEINEAFSVIALYQVRNGDQRGHKHFRELHCTLTFSCMYFAF